MKRWTVLFAMLTILLVLTACNTSNGENSSGSENNGTMDNEEQQTEETKESITVDMMNQEGEKVGTAELEQQEDGTLIQLDASNLPEGTHGFHIHETGSCEAPDFKSAGGHFNPANADHGTMSEDGPHAGDMENIEVSADGTIQKEVVNEKVTLEAGKDNSLLKEGGTALVIHAGADDNSSQPSGDAGDRIACGVIVE
ncbi:superoxide dismutase family protein [Pseudalkalibacillus hwajinpoensis]|uniref:Superoxide dismutase [Cu-Zn] n=1 Tax=Guptibacillus hwajinpoensis TaxID=208199 RepID=A0A4U1MNF3_9BACL|nr:superoxide dismutase family protein [Pseudalkalibacillus hwajinpoensis]TKD72291.1 superoxide dismutase family protein [Pseudalkalibacillus hwajinpoensis]